MIMKKIRQVFDALAYASAVVAGCAAMIMMLATVADIFCRAVFSHAITGVYEITMYFLMPMSVFLALPAAYSADILPKVSNMMEKAVKPVRIFFEYSVFVIEIVVYSLLTYYAFRFMARGFFDKIGFTMGGRQYPLYPVYVVVPIGFLLTLILAFVIRLTQLCKASKE